MKRALDYLYAKIWKTKNSVFILKILILWVVVSKNVTANARKKASDWVELEVRVRKTIELIAPKLGIWVMKASD